MPPGGQGSTYRYVGDEDMPAFDGWESLGDLGKLDEEGYLYLGDRKSDMIIKGQDVDNIYLGDTLTDDGFRTKHFDFLLSNPPAPPAPSSLS